MIAIEPFFVFVNVHVTLSPGETLMEFTELPSLQVALVWTQLPTAASPQLKVPGVTMTSIPVVLEAFRRSRHRAGSPSGAEQVKLKSCGSLGTASLTIVMEPPWCSCRCR